MARKPRVSKPKVRTVRVGLTVSLADAPRGSQLHPKNAVERAVLDISENDLTMAGYAFYSGEQCIEVAGKFSDIGARLVALINASIGSARMADADGGKHDLSFPGYGKK